MPALVTGPVEGLALLGGGTAFPEPALDNLEVLRRLGPRLFGERAASFDDERLAFLAQGLAESTGVARRGWVHEPGTPLDPAREASVLDLGREAAARALDDAALSPADVGLVIACTSTPHRMTSTLSGALGAALGVRSPCMDLRTGCSAFLFALVTAALHVQAGAGPVLLVGAETFSKIVPAVPGAKEAALALGDGAGAVVLGAGGGALLGALLDTDGALGRLVSTDGALPPLESEIARGGYLLSGAPAELLATIPGKYALAIAGALGRAGLEGSDVDLFVPHQTSVPLVRGLATRFGIPEARTFVNVPVHANVGAAGCVAALAEARAEGRAPSGARILLAAVGGGMSWGSVVLRA